MTRVGLRRRVVGSLRMFTRTKLVRLFVSACALLCSTVVSASHASSVASTRSALPSSTTPSLPRNKAPKVSPPMSRSASPNQAGSSAPSNHSSSPPPPKTNEPKQHSQAPLSSFKLILLAMMVLQNSSTVLVGRYTRTSVPKDQQYSVNHLLLVIEFTKLVLSAVLEFYTSNGRLWESMQLHIVERPYDALKILVPALLYLVQNTLLYVALSNLTAPIFQVTYQGKLVTTAIVSVILLQRQYSVQQWVCLVALSLGVAVVVLDKDSKSGGESKMEQNIVLGLIAVSIACLSSALAGVYFEMVLKKPTNESTPPASLWMRNMQLAFFSVCIALGQGVWEGATTKNDDEEFANNKPYLHGFTTWAWILVGLQAGGGLLVAAVIKYADNVLKGLATGVSVVLATALSTLLFGTPLTGQFSLGAILILAAVYYFSNPLPSRTSSSSSSSSKKQETEMKSLLPK